MKKQILFITIALLAVSVQAAITGTASAQTFYGPTEYVQTSNSPFDGLSFSDFYLEDFEDGSLNTQGLSVDGGILASLSSYPREMIDSVDADNGPVDGWGNDGESWFRSSGSTGLTFTFDAAVLGSLPTHAGIVWTDGDGTITFKAFDSGGVSLGTIGPWSDPGVSPDSYHEGETGEDRFFGVSDPGGIWKIRISNSWGGIEVDHIQYGIDGTAAEEVDIPDPGLEAAIRWALGIPTDPITVTDLEGLTSLNAFNDEITDLTGLEYCVNLHNLNLSFNTISDISLLSELTNLDRLWLDRNWISDISALSELTNLEQLHLDNNFISDISPLSELTKLWDLDLSTNNISDISPLSELTDLEWLWLGTNNISDISALSELTDLKRLFLDDNFISNIQALVDNPGLSAGDDVYLRDNPLSYLAIVIDVPALQDRGVIVYLSPPVEVVIPDPGLEAAIREALGIPTDPITDIDLKGLTSLNAHGRGITDLTGLEYCVNLDWLRLNDNEITDISALSELTYMEWLLLDDNNISDIQPLVDNPGLSGGDNVYLSANPLSYEGIYTDIPVLQDRGVDVYFSSPAENLIATVEGLDLFKGSPNPLRAQLKGADRASEKGNDQAAIKHLSIFIDHCQKMRGTKLTEADATNLILDAEAMIAWIKAG